MSRCTKPHNNSLDRDWYILYLINCTTYFSPLFRERHHLPWPLPGTSDWSTAYHRLQDVLQGTVPISRPPSIIQSVLVYPMRPPLYRHVSMHAQWYWGLLFCKYQFILFPLLTHTHTHTHTQSTSPTDGSEEPYILNVPLGVISHVEKIGRSRNKKENAYGLEIFCKVIKNLCLNEVLLWRYWYAYISHKKK